MGSAMRTSVAALFLAAGCVVRPVVVAPAPYVAVVPAVPAGRAASIAVRFTAAQGYRPAGVRDVRLERGGRVWDVLVRMGPPACGWNRVIVNAFNGFVIASRPVVFACGYLGPPPGAPVYVVP